MGGAKDEGQVVFKLKGNRIKLCVILALSEPFGSMSVDRKGFDNNSLIEDENRKKKKFKQSDLTWSTLGNKIVRKFCSLFPVFIFL